MTRGVPVDLLPVAGCPALVRLDGRDHVLWWGAHPRDDPNDHRRDCVAVVGGRLARAADAAARGWPAAAEEAVPLDVDVVRSWLAGRRLGVPHVAVLDLWNLAGDVAGSLGAARHDRGRVQDRCYRVLLAVSLPWLLDVAEFRPRWSARDLDVLRARAAADVGLLRAALPPARRAAPRRACSPERVQIDGKVFLVTGASSGIGAATARAASAAGARLVLVARRGDLLAELAAELGDAIAVPADVTDSAQVRAAVQAAVDAHGRVDVLVNNAGQGLHQPLADVDPDDFRAVLDLNVVAPLVALQAVLPVMRAQGGGAVVDVSSGTSRVVLPGVGAYAASKAALNQLSATARLELAADGVVVSTLHPFITATGFHDNLRAGALRHRPDAPQAHTAEHVADAVLALVRSGDPELVLVPEGFGAPR